jgi:predicted peroxiredoxin
MSNEANAKVVINLATGTEDPERVLVAFLVASAALDAGKTVAFFLTKEAVRLALPGHAVGEACRGCPPLERLFEQVAEKGGELLACPICLNAARARRRRARLERTRRRRHAPLGVDRRGRYRVQLLTQGGAA